MENKHRFSEREGCRSLKVLRIVGIAIAGISLAVLFALLFGWVVMLLWNWLVPSIFGLKAITYWQAFGITVLAKIFFSGVHGDAHKADKIHRSVDHRWHRWMGIDDEASLGEGFGRFSHREMKHYRDFWKERGEAAFEEYLRDIGPDNSRNAKED
ncbi:MAG: hypothetical protein JW913_00425 [Chitinispirillaceae bacterium]|nr:hypothetical protein [Chitinispirillaceae bacterium]